MDRSVWIGWEPREADAFAVARHSCFSKMGARTVSVHGLVLSKLRRDGLYTRPHSRKKGQLWDDISDAPMSTQFACSRFLVPHIVRTRSKSSTRPRWALFLDCDMLFRADVHKLFDACDPEKAVMVVKHDHNPENAVKMDGRIQTRYSRKNWSSVCAFNVDHPANDALTPELINSLPGRDLHAFCWLMDDNLIGELRPEWNYLVGHTTGVDDPKIVHHTDGVPSMHGYEDAEYADEWTAALEDWAAA